MNSRLISASPLLLWISLQLAVAQVSSPRITSVTQVWPRSYQTIQISGSGFGSSRPYDGDSAFILITDLTQNWSAGHTGDAVTLNIGTWSDSLISINYLDGAYGTGNQSFVAGDTISIKVWNAQTGAGPAKAQVTVLTDDTVVFNFPGTPGPTAGGSGLISDSAGNFYGLGGGGLNNYGSAYEVSQSTGVWSETLLYSFPPATFGWDLLGPPARDSAGNLYGVTGYSTSTSECFLGCGTVFEISGGVLTTLHTFTRGSDGAFPVAGLTMGADGNLYGTTSRGGPLDLGTIYELTPDGSGGWNYSIVYEFQGGAGDGAEPYSSFTLDSAGNLYGTTYAGGGTEYCGYNYIPGCGTIFEITPSVGGVTERVLYAFHGVLNGTQPTTGVTFDAAGNLYGVTRRGGAISCSRNSTAGCGIAYALSPQSNGTWKQRTLFDFSNNLSNVDGAILPYSQLTYHKGVLYGYAAGGASQDGTIYTLTQNGQTWTEKTIYSFGINPDGANPSGSPIFGKDGTMYGLAAGGVTNAGVIFTLP